MIIQKVLFVGCEYPQWRDEPRVQRYSIRRGDVKRNDLVFWNELLAEVRAIRNVLHTQKSQSLRYIELHTQSNGRFMKI